MNVLQWRLSPRDIAMNRKKKIKTILTKKLKKTQKREAPKNSNKPRYISKAERAELETCVNGPAENLEVSE
ncbi:hypothetical protein A3759_06475 [Thalassolituus sp. HI0120]|nr:hypothetical protein A3759_09260 [Thalassolituus sp. HI0120]KZZ46633.1 hypothetical protein A3759_06475 [Thalassolituus sp. HI0120]